MAYYEFRMIVVNGGSNHVDVLGKEECIEAGRKACIEHAGRIGKGKITLEVSPKSNLKDIVYRESF
jgi:hypothetical protein